MWKNTSTNINTAVPITDWETEKLIIDYDVDPLVTYFYWVKSAVSNTGEKESPNYSDYVAGKTGLMSAPQPDASDGEFDDKIEISWNIIPDATHYKLFRDTIDNPYNSSPITPGWITATSYTDNYATHGVLYYYWVKAATTSWGK